MTPTVEELTAAILHMVSRLPALRAKIRREAFEEAANLIESASYYAPAPDRGVIEQRIRAIETLAYRVRRIDNQ